MPPAMTPTTTSTTTPPPPPPASGVVVFVPGLTDGLLGCGYVERLANACMEENFIFVQPTLSSSWNGYGTTDVETDVEELDHLFDALVATRRVASGCDSVVLVGHSTGCQDAV